MIIKIDIDTKNFDIDEFDKKLKSLMRMNKISEIDVSCYETNKGFHFYLENKQEYMSAKDCLIWQLILGSDIYREIFNYQRILTQKLNGEDWNVLFELKKQNDVFVSKERLIGSRKVTI